MKTTLMPSGLLQRYMADPLRTDAEVRKTCNVPEHRYYSVTTWPTELAGRVWVDSTRTRTVPAKKISKSDQN
jgi:hypothetical protein